VLAGFGDDPHRYGDAKASGNTHHQALRVLRNKRTGILRLHWPPPALRRSRRMGPQPPLLLDKLEPWDV